MRRDHFPDFLFLMETKNSSTHVTSMQGWLGYDNKHIVDPVGLSGGLGLFWKSSYQVDVISSSNRIIDVGVRLGSISFFISFVYGDPARNVRQEVWDTLVDIGGTRNEAWLIVGDLNEILDNSEKLGGPPREEATFYPFRNMVRDCGVREIPHSGNKFSWAGMRSCGWVQCCLDRAMGNTEWFTVFPRVHGEFFERIGSDHRPLLVRFVNENLSKVGRFIFDKRWVSKPEVREVIHKVWNQDNEDRWPLMDRIAECRRALSKWKRTADTNSKDRIKKLKARIEEEGVKQSPDLLLMKNLRWDLALAYKEEEVYWKQKSKERWLADGDRNTKFFHGSVKKRRAQNGIPALVNSNGSEQITEGSKGSIAVDYFRELFTSTKPGHATELLAGMAPRVTTAMNRELTKPVTNKEIRDAAFGIKRDKAPGADGMTGHFFQTYWDIVGPQVIRKVRGFFESGDFPQDWNFTQICLIPKKINPNKMTDLRPISLCAVSYKIVSRVMCTRLKGFLPKIVSETQGAFVSGRLISDNILVAHEMIHGLRTNPRCSEDFMALKTDMSKAYDRVEWDFLEELFGRLGFHQKWIGWVMTCVRSVTYSVLLNGRSHGFIKPERGLRQGDPLSPFLFILCAEALVHTMKVAEREGRITGMRLRRHSPSIQQLLFADDSLFLCLATFKEGSEILKCLKLYGEASGQEINFQKSSITFGSKIDPYMRNLMGLYMGITQEGGAGKYLGLPECFSGSKREMLAYITDKLKSRLGGWYEKTLSLGGKEILLKSVAMAMPVYAMSCFRLTKFQCQKITSAMSSFWWNNFEDKKKIHWVSWKKLCKPKKEGGMGFKDIEDFNQALLAKQAWRLLSDPQSLLARLYKSRYYPKQGFLDASLGARPSYAWRSIVHGRELLEKGLMKVVGNGAETRVWLDNWVMDEIPRRPVNKEVRINLRLRVSELITPQGSWDYTQLKVLFPTNDVKRIMSFPPDITTRDSWIWALTKEGTYSVKSGGDLIARMKPETILSRVMEGKKNELKSKVWKIKTLPKIKTFMWRILAGALAVAEGLRAHGMQVDPRCKVCMNTQESITHVLFECTVARQVWNRANIPFNSLGAGTVIDDYMSLMFKIMETNMVEEKYRRALPWILWGVWKQRNFLVYVGGQSDADIVIAKALEDSEEWLRLQEVEVAATGTTGVVEKGERRWTKPSVGMLKCNVSASWSNFESMCGGAWLLRDHAGEVCYHARDIFLPAQNRLTAELRCIMWAAQSIKDLRCEDIEIWSDCSMAIEAIKNPRNWPRYRTYLDRFNRLRRQFRSCEVKLSSFKANGAARKIAKSVTRDGRVHSYLAVGGPAWLLSVIEEDRSSETLL